MVVAAGTTASVGAQWPTTCVDLNDIVERHLGNDANVGIYQRAFENQAEHACQGDHREDVRGVFAWALSNSSLPDASDGVAPADIGGWPTTCVELNDIVETHLGNDHNVTIYQRTFAAEAESACRSDHRADVQEVFSWAVACDPGTAAHSVQTTGRAPPNTPPYAMAALAQTDSSLLNVLTTMPWLACHTYPWLADGVSDDDRTQLQLLNEVNSVSEQAASLVANSAWFQDEIDHDDPHSSSHLALRTIRALSARNLSLRQVILSYPWITDDMTGEESHALYWLLQLSDQDPQLALRLANTEWINDGILDYEANGISTIDLMLRNPPEGARELIEYTLREPIYTSDLVFLRELYGLRFGSGTSGRSDGSAYASLRSQPWFVDGLNAQERAFISAIAGSGYMNPHFERLAQIYYAVSSTISLPLTGPVKLWAFQHEPITAGDDLLGMVAQGLLGAERIMGTALGANDVVVYLRGFYGGAHWPNHVGLPNPTKYPARLTRDLVFESVAKLYFDSSLGPNYPDIDSRPEGSPILYETWWLKNGGSEFSRALTKHWLGFKSILVENHEWVEEAQANCTDRGLTSIHSISRRVYPLDVVEDNRYRECTEAYGRMLLVRLFLTIGEERMSAAFAELHHIANYNDGRINDEGIRFPSEKDVFRTFIKHTPPHLQDEVRHWYRQFHGAPFIDELR